MSIIDFSEFESIEEWLGKKVVLDMYSITLKDDDCGLYFGRKNYDFDEGVLLFTAPNQAISISQTQKLNEQKGWMMVFHPDLIRNTFLERKTKKHKFFSFENHEALHLSETEQQIITNCVNFAKNEIQKDTDNYSKTVLTSTLDLLLNFCSRFYERQFNTRSIENNYTVNKVVRILEDYYESGLFLKEGIPSVELVAKKIGYSSNYLSELLKKETGKSAKDFINYFIVDKAKTLLLKEKTKVSKLAYDLGFNYPHYFSRLFKTKTGMTPQEFRRKY